MSAFAENFARAKARMSPELAQAISVILNALFEDPPFRDKNAEARVKSWDEAQRKKRIERAERGVKTRRKNAKKKACSSSTTRANSRQYCFKKLDHRGVHSNGFYNWKRPTKKAKRK